MNFNSNFAVVSYFREFEIKDQAQSMLSRLPIKILNCFLMFDFTNNFTIYLGYYDPVSSSQC